MKCQFCQQRCSLLQKEDPDYTSYDLNWECKHHPVKVVHVVRRRFYSLRRDREIRGEQRTWKNTFLMWKVGKLYWKVSFYRKEEIIPTFFVVDILADRTPNHFSSANKYGVLKLGGHPKEITPENVINKIKTYIVFS
jgi:hypothetical protein